MVTADRRCVKPTFPRLPPNFPTPPAAPTPPDRAPQLKLPSAPSQKDSMLSVVQQELRVGGERKQVGYRKKERDGSNWIHRFLRN